MSSVTQPADRPLRADAERNRRLIIDAASELFAERGLAASMDEVAARAGVGVGTVYRRFPDKERLIDALFEERIGAMAQFADEGLAMEDPWEGLAHLIERGAELHANNVALRELLFSRPESRVWVDRARAEMIPRVRELIERAQRSGQLREGIETTDIPLIQLTLAQLHDLTREVGPDLWRRMLAIVLDGLRASRPDAAPLPAGPLTPELLMRAMTSGR